MTPDTDTAGKAQLQQSAGMREIRIEWRLGYSSGGGLWVSDTERNRKVLMSHVVSGDIQYGAGTHWIAERQA